MAAGLLFFSVLGIAGAAGADLSGTWLVSGPVSPECHLVQQDTVIQGSCKGPNSQGTVTGSIQGQAVKWTYNWTPLVTGKPGAFEFSGTLDGDWITGTVNTNGHSGAFTATRAAAGLAQQATALQASLPVTASAPGLAPGVPAIDKTPGKTQGRTTRDVVAAPQPLVRMSAGSVCESSPGLQMAKMPGGRVAVTYAVNADGMVEGASLLASSGNPILDGFAIRCVRTWQFAPLALTGATAPLIASAAATFAFRNAGSKRLSQVGWETPLLKEASDVAVAALAEIAYQCLRTAPPVVAFAAKTPGTTTLQLLYRHGDVTSAKVLASSGNSDLDGAALSCYRGVPHDDGRARMMEKLSDSNIALSWAVLFPAR